MGKPLSRVPATRRWPADLDLKLHQGGSLGFLGHDPQDAVSHVGELQRDDVIPAEQGDYGEVHRQPQPRFCLRLDRIVYLLRQARELSFVDQPACGVNWVGVDPSLLHSAGHDPAEDQPELLTGAI